MVIDRGKLPQKLHRYFWDVDIIKMNPYKKPEFIISRLLDKGDIEAVKWVGKTFSKSKIKKTLLTTRDFSLRSASFWGLIYNIPYPYPLISSTKNI